MRVQTFLRLAGFICAVRSLAALNQIDAWTLNWWLVTLAAAILTAIFLSAHDSLSERGSR